jgi:hypothetical protein
VAFLACDAATGALPVRYVPCRGEGRQAIGRLFLAWPIGLVTRSLTSSSK